MFAVAIFSDMKDKPFVGLITDKPDRAKELVEVSKSVENYTFIRAGSKAANDYMIRAYEILAGMEDDDGQEGT